MDSVWPVSAIFIISSPYHASSTIVQCINLLICFFFLHAFVQLGLYQNKDIYKSINGWNHLFEPGPVLPVHIISHILLYLGTTGDTVGWGPFKKETISNKR